ncbi:MAG: putative toxin-antitoxin system toxin component, PIN family [Lachnospiraceae bacterium]|nr:putative toxin-antitoxin system toxin component, PIN family [Lachnospiraceae bacterium]
MRIVIDTNVVASAIFFGGRPRDLMEKLLLQRFEAYASPDIINEYKETIEELCDRYPQRPENIPLTTILSSMKMIQPTTHIEVCRDPDDNKFIECAHDAKCLYIVSGDKDLLSLKSYREIEIVTVSDFLSKYNNL